MRYLFLIIRHLFPRKRWRIIGTTKTFYDGDTLPSYITHTLQDQFGNIKTKRI